MIPGLGSGRAIYLATGVTDLRHGISALYARILNELQHEPLSGAICGFANRRRDAVELFAMTRAGSGSL